MSRSLLELMLSQKVRERIPELGLGLFGSQESGDPSLMGDPEFFPQPTNPSIGNIGAGGPQEAPDRRQGVPGTMGTGGAALPGVPFTPPGGIRGMQVMGPEHPATRQGAIAAAKAAHERGDTALAESVVARIAPQGGVHRTEGAMLQKIGPGGIITPVSMGGDVRVQREPEPAPGEKGRSAFARLFAGERVAGLTQKENTMLRRRSMVMAGLHILGAPPGTALGQAVAMGVIAARQDSTETAGALLDIKRAQAGAAERFQLFADADLSEIEKWEEARRLAFKQGDTEAVKEINAILKEMRDLGEGEAGRRLQVIGGVPYFVDEPANRIYDADGEEVPAEAFHPQEQFARPEVDNWHPVGDEEIGFDKFGRPVPGARRPAVPVEPSVPNQDEVRALQAAHGARQLRQELDVMRETVAAVRVPASERVFTPGTEEARRFQAATANALTLIQRHATATGTLSARAAVMFVEQNTPKFGDSRKVIEEKLERIEAEIGKIEAAAGPIRVGEQDGSPTAGSAGADRLRRHFD